MMLELKTEEERRLVIAALDEFAAGKARWRPGIGWVSNDKEEARAASVAGELADRARRA
jgi:hypothetical protein